MTSGDMLLLAFCICYGLVMFIFILAQWLILFFDRTLNDFGTDR